MQRGGIIARVAVASRGLCPSLAPVSQAHAVSVNCLCSDLHPWIIVLVFKRHQCCCLLQPSLILTDHWTDLLAKWPPEQWLVTLSWLDIFLINDIKFKWINWECRKWAVQELFYDNYTNASIKTIIIIIINFIVGKWTLFFVVTVYINENHSKCIK